MSEFDREIIMKILSYCGGSGKATAKLYSMYQKTNNSEEKISSRNGEIAIEDLISFNRILDTIFQSYYSGDFVKLAMSHISQLTVMSSVMVIDIYIVFKLFKKLINKLKCQIYFLLSIEERSNNYIPLENVSILVFGVALQGGDGGTAEFPIEVNCRDLLNALLDATPPKAGEQNIEGLIHSMSEELFGRVYYTSPGRNMQLDFKPAPSAV